MEKMGTILKQKTSVQNYLVNFDLVVKLVPHWLRFRKKQKEIKAKILNKICNYLELDVILQETVAGIKDVLDLDYCIFFWCDLSQKRIKITTESFGNRNLKDQDIFSQIGHHPLEAFGNFDSFLESQQLSPPNCGFFSSDRLNLETIIKSNDLQTEAEESQTIFGYNSYIFIPICQQKEQFGFVGCFSNDKRQWLEKKIKFIQDLKPLLSIAVSHGELYQEVTQIAKRERLVNHITQQTRSSLDLERILKNTIKELLQALDADRCLIHLVEESPEERDNSLVRYQHLYESVQKPFAASISYFDPHGPITNWVIENQEIVVINDVTKDERIDQNNPEYVKAEIKSSLVVPVIYSGKIYAIIYLNQCSHQRNWTKSDQLLAKSIADQLAISIRQAQLYHSMEASALKSKAQAQKLAETLQELKQTQAQLIQTEKMSSLAQMVAGVSHELNNPVSFIYGNIPFLKDHIEGMVNLLQTYQEQYPDPDSPIPEMEKELELDFVLTDISQILESMKQGATRVKKIVNLLQNFSHLNEAPFKEVDLNQSLEHTLLILNHQIGDRIKLEKDYDNLPPVECYPQLMNQVFLGLLNNGIQALLESKKEAKILRITSRVISETMIEISIEDNGIGIPLEIQPKIFDPFFTTKQVGQGQGMGLTFCYQTIVTHHHGQLTFHSQPNQGTTFTIQLPIKQKLGNRE